MAEVATEKLISTPTKCKLCSHVFKAPLLAEAAVLGEDPSVKAKRMKRLVQPLIEHLAKHHKEKFLNDTNAGQKFATYLWFTSFEMDDQTKEKLEMDKTRWKIRQMMTRQESRVSDDRINERLTRALETWLPASGDRADHLYSELFAIMTNMRDVLEECNRYPNEDTQSGSQAQVVK